jgi:hypothetical protein
MGEDGLFTGSVLLVEELDGRELGAEEGGKRCR